MVGPTTSRVATSKNKSHVARLSISNFAVIPGPGSTMRRTAWGVGWSSSPPRGTRDEGREARKSRPLPTRPCPLVPCMARGRTLGGTSADPSTGRVGHAGGRPGRQERERPRCLTASGAVMSRGTPRRSTCRRVGRRGGEARRAAVLIRAPTARSWHLVAWREGSQGGMRGRFVAVRGWRVTSSGRRRAGWLIGEDASEGKRRYSWSHFGPEVALERRVESAHRRHWWSRITRRPRSCWAGTSIRAGWGGASIDTKVV